MGVKGIIFVIANDKYDKTFFHTRSQVEEWLYRF
jgi:hypothetical protein